MTAFSIIKTKIEILQVGIFSIAVLAWAILPLDFQIDFGLYYFRSWRLLTIAYASVFIIAAILVSFGPESPKFLISQGKHDEALKVLQDIYSGNKGKSPEDYPVCFCEITFYDYVLMIKAAIILIFLHNVGNFLLSY